MDPAVLRHAAMFAELSDEQLARIAAIARTETYQPGAVIFKELDPGDRLFLILDGEVRISREIPAAGEEALAILKTGACFGEMAVFDQPVRSTDAYAHSRCTLASIAQPELDVLLEQDHELGYRVLRAVVRSLAMRLRGANDQLRSVLAMSMF
ncbi:MAG: Crp/Fnr family transcriptional regulator [Gemmatimonadales bacterium]